MLIPAFNPTFIYKDRHSLRKSEWVWIAKGMSFGDFWRTWWRPFHREQIQVLLLVAQTWGWASQLVDAPTFTSGLGRVPASSHDSFLARAVLWLRQDFCPLLLRASKWEWGHTWRSTPQPTCFEKLLVRCSRDGPRMLQYERSHQHFPPHSSSKWQSPGELVFVSALQIIWELCPQEEVVSTASPTRVN